MNNIFAFWRGGQRCECGFKLVEITEPNPTKEDPPQTATHPFLWEKSETHPYEAFGKFQDPP